MPVAPSQVMASFVQERLARVLASPDAWGPPHAVELQTLLLVEMWHVAAGTSLDIAHRVPERFARFLAMRLPGPPAPLSVRLKLTSRASDAFVAQLAAFVREEQDVPRAANVIPLARSPRLPLPAGPVGRKVG